MKKKKTLYFTIIMTLYRWTGTSVNERLYLLNNCQSIIVISEWIKNRLLKDISVNDDLRKINVIPPLQIK